MKPSLAYLYHLQHQSYTQDLPFWLSLANKFGGPVLELGCGSGRVLLHLHQAGFKVVGLDKDEDMLTILKQQAAYSPIIELLQADFRHFHLGQKFNLILLPCNTLSTLGAQDRRALFQGVERHMPSGGAFAFSMPNPAWWSELPQDAEEDPEEILFVPDLQAPLQISSAWQQDDSGLEVTWHYDLLLEDGLIERQSVSVFHEFVEPEELTNEILSMGFKVDLYGDFNFDPYTPESDYLIALAMKK